MSFAALLMVVLAIQTPLEQAHQLADRAQAASLSAQTPGLEAAASRRPRLRPCHAGRRPRVIRAAVD
ncbi:hypothetical protein ACRAWD_05230 [Caulobacter segnis]